MLFPRIVGRLGLVVLVVIGCLVNPQGAVAQSTWDGGGGDNNWGTAANWSDNQVPSFPTPLVFSGTTRPMPNNDLGNVSVDGVTFNSGAAAFNLGGDAFTLGDEATADYRRGGISQQDDSLQTIANNITVSRGLHEISTAQGAGGLTFSGAIARNPGLGVRFAPLGGPIKTTLTNTNGIIGGWATSQNPNPTLASETFLWSKVDANGNVVPYLDYTAADDIDGFAATPETTLPAGVNSTSNIRWFGGSFNAANEAGLTLTANTDMNTFLYEQDATNAFDLAGFRLRFTNGGGIFRSNPAGQQNSEDLRFGCAGAGTTCASPGGGTVTAGNSSSPATLYIWKNSTIADPPTLPNGEESNFNINFRGVYITDNPEGGKVTVVSNGSGGVRTSEVNGGDMASWGTGHTFSGGLYINRGVWRAEHHVSNAFGAGDVHVASGAQAYVNQDGMVPNDFYFAGTGINENTFHVGAIRVAADGAVLNGNIFLTADTRLGSRGAQATAAQLGMPNDQGVVWNGKITGNFDLELNIKNDQGQSTLEGDMPTMIFTNSANDWGGDTTIGNGRVRIGGSGEVIPHGPGKGNLTLLGEGVAAARPTVLTLDSHTETVNGLSSQGALSEIFITNQTAGTATLRVGANDATSTFGGTIQDDTANGGIVALSKIGAGTLTLTGANAYSGDTRVEGGTLSIGNAFLADAADVHVGSGALFNLNFSGTDTIDALFLGGIPRAPGTWGGAGSGATNISPFLTGTGRLMVTTMGMVQLLAGDYNGNGVVDAADYVVWRDALGTNTQLQNEGPGVTPGMVTQEDYATWRSNFGRSAGGGAGLTSLVPEPSTLLLLVSCGLMSLGSRRLRATS
jgi:autotransporter-associated beta strand protein